MISIQLLQPFVSWLLLTSWQASLLALFVLLLQRIFRNRLDARWIYALWGLVLIRLLAPSLPQSPSNIYHITSVPSSPSVWIESAPPSPFPAPIETAVPSFSTLELFTLCWFIGALAVAVATLGLHFRLHRKLRHSKPVEDLQIKNLIQSCATELHVSRPPRAVIFSSVSSPSVMGLWRPILLLPSDLLSRFSPEELRFIFLHELAHLKRGDLVVQWLLTFLQIFHWFNPVLWFAFSRIRQDREAATDAMVLAQTGETSRCAYGNTLLKLLEQFEHRNSPANVVGILENKGSVQKRILHIARFNRGAYRWSLLAFLLLGGIAVFFLTSPKQEFPEPVSQKVDPPELNRFEKERIGAKYQIEVEARLIEVPVSRILPAELPKFRAAVKDNDFIYLSTIKGTNLLTCPRIVLQEDKNAQIEVVRDFHFPSKAEKTPGHSMAPLDFATIPVGVTINFTVKTQTEGLMLSGTLEIRELAGLTQEENNMGVSFNTQETRFNTLLQDSLPRVANSFLSTIKQTMEKNGTKREELIEKETFLILTAKKVAL